MKSYLQRATAQLSPFLGTQCRPAGQGQIGGENMCSTILGEASELQETGSLQANDIIDVQVIGYSLRRDP